MKNLNFPLARLIAAVAFLAALPVLPLRAEDSEFGTNVGMVIIPEGLSKEEVRSTCASAFAGRNWTVKEKSDTRVVGYLNHRGHEATLTLIITGEEVQLYCVGYVVGRSGERRRPEMPDGWISNIKKDLTKLLNVKAASK